MGDLPERVRSIVRRDEAICERVGGDTVVLEPESGRYVRLNRSGAWLWQSLERPRSERQLEEALVERFGITRQRAAADAAAFVADLKSLDLVSVVEA